MNRISSFFRSNIISKAIVPSISRRSIVYTPDSIANVGRFNGKFFGRVSDDFIGLKCMIKPSIVGNALGLDKTVSSISKMTKGQFITNDDSHFTLLVNTGEEKKTIAKRFFTHEYDVKIELNADIIYRVASHNLNNNFLDIVKTHQNRTKEYIENMMVKEIGYVLTKYKYEEIVFRHVCVVNGEGKHINTDVLDIINKQLEEKLGVRCFIKVNDTVKIEQDDLFPFYPYFVVLGILIGIFE